MIKTLKDLNQAGNRFWSRPNRDDAGKRAQAKDKESIQEQVRKYIKDPNYNPPDFNTREFEREYLKQSGAQDDDLYDRIKAVAEGGINSKQRELLGYARGALSSGNRVSARKYLEQALAAEDSAQDFSTTPAEIEAAAKKAKAAGKSKGDFVAGYSGGAAETAARVW